MYETRQIRFRIYNNSKPYIICVGCCVITSTFSNWHETIELHNNYNLNVYPIRFKIILEA